MGSESSSDRETSRSLSPDNSKDGLGRSYECNFCKRGFTNAQALGGHMNIHRKDKAKAKQNKTFTTTITKPKKDHSIVSSESFKLIPNEESQYRGSSFGIRSGDHGYDHFSPPNPNFPWTLAASQFDNRALHEHHLRVNLNLGIGSSEMGNSNIEGSKVGQEDWFDNEVDLELRLGHYP